MKGMIFVRNAVVLGRDKDRTKTNEDRVVELCPRARTVLEPYNARHSFVTWNPMAGKNIVWAADQHGHWPETMLSTYARWLRGATEEDIEAIKRAMVNEAHASRADASPQVPPDPLNCHQESAGAG